jgi:hypothetical protein
MAPHRNPVSDPVASATALLRRLGFATLMLVIPSLALVSRRAVVVLAPIGIALLIIAAILDGENRPLGRSNRAFAGSVPVLATIVLLVWLALSLIWTPFHEPAAARLGSILAMTALVVAGYYALPDRMRASNIYLLAIGVSVAAVAGIALSALYGQGLVEPPDGASTLERGLVTMVIMVWPAVAWLSSRHRDVQAVLLALAVGAASFLGPTILPFVAFLVSGAVCVLATSAPRFMAAATAKGLAGLILLAPLAPFIAAPFTASGEGGGLLASLAIWRDLITGEPLRLLTGYGLEAALRGRGSGLLPADAPYSLLFEIWFDLGAVGAVAAAVALHGAVIAATRSHPPLTPGALATFVAAFAMTVMGVATTQMWWVTTLIVVPLIFIAAARGQFRTKRPKALLRMIGDR